MTTTHLFQNDFSNFAVLVQVEVDDAVVPVLFLSHLHHLPELHKDQRFASGHDSPAHLQHTLLRNLGDAQHVHDVLRVDYRMVDAYETDLADQLVVAHLFLRPTGQTVLDHHVLLEIGQIDLLGEKPRKLEMREDEKDCRLVWLMMIHLINSFGLVHLINDRLPS